MRRVAQAGDVAEVTAGPPGAGPTAGAAGHLRRPGVRGLVVVVAAFALSRGAYALAGVRFDAGAIHRTGPPEDQWQLLDVGLLHHHLLQSLANLHSQPPLYNLYCGLLLQLPAGSQQWVAAACYLVLGVAMVAATYLLALEVGLPVWAATVLGLVVVATPAAVLYENWLSWTYPAAALVTVAAWCLARFLRSGRWGWGLAAFAAFAAVLLDDSLYQWIWLVALVAVALVAARVGWRRVLAAAAVPVLVVAAWYTNDAVRFGTATTSSWLGMNLASTTVSLAPKGQLRAMVRRGTLAPIALVAPFGPVRDFVPRFVHPAHTGIPALDERNKSDGDPNFDNLAYVAVARRYLSADLAYARAHPRAYAGHVLLAAEVWFVAPDDYPFLRPNAVRISGYTRVADAVLLGQASPAPLLDPGFAARLGGVPPPLVSLSWLVVLADGLLLVGAPILVVRRRADRAMAGTLAVVWVTVAYLLVVTSLVSVGENNRFAFELGALPLVGAAVVVAEVARARATGRRGPSLVGRWRRYRSIADPDPGAAPAPAPTPGSPPATNAR